MHAPTLQTERLLLRQLQHDDIGIIYALRSDGRVNRFIARPPVTTREEAAIFITGIINKINDPGTLYWVIQLQHPLQPVGTICLWNFSADRKSAELGYELHPEFHGRGLMQEAAAAVTAFAFSELQLEILEAFTHRDNDRSIRLLEKSGFRWLPERKDNDVPSNAVYQLQKPASVAYSRAKDP